MPILISQFLPPSLSLLVSIHLFCMPVSLFMPCRQVHLYHFSRSSHGAQSRSVQSGKQGAVKAVIRGLELTTNYCPNFVIFSLVLSSYGQFLCRRGERCVEGIVPIGEESGCMWNWFGRYTVHLCSELQGLNFLKCKNIARMS